eukprot:4469834-Amphidinium_carterae.1
MTGMEAMDLLGAAWEHMPETFEATVEKMRLTSADAHSPDAESQLEQELEALRSMYAEEMLSTLSEPGDGLRIMRLALPVHVEVKTVAVQVRTPDGIVSAGEVEHLPPLLIFVAVPHGYPLDNSQMPAFTLKAPHLGNLKVQELSACLHEAATQSGEMVLLQSALALQGELYLDGPLVLE